MENDLLNLYVNAKKRKLDAIRDEKNKKAAAWQALKEKSPELALTLENHFKAFGRPAHISIEIAGVEIYTNRKL